MADWLTIEAIANGRVLWMKHPAHGLQPVAVIPTPLWSTDQQLCAEIARRWNKVVPVRYEGVYRATLGRLADMFPDSYALGLPAEACRVVEAAIRLAASTLELYEAGRGPAANGMTLDEALAATDNVSRAQLQDVVEFSEAVAAYKAVIEGGK